MSTADFFASISLDQGLKTICACFSSLINKHKLVGGWMDGYTVIAVQEAFSYVSLGFPGEQTNQQTAAMVNKYFIIFTCV